MDFGSANRSISSSFTIPPSLDWNHVNELTVEKSFVDKSLQVPSLLPCDQKHDNVVPSVVQEKSFWEDSDLNDVVLKYINQILMEENMEENMFQESSLALQAAERSFYEVLGKKYPASPPHQPRDFNQNLKILDYAEDSSKHSRSDCWCSTAENVSDPLWKFNCSKYKSCDTHTIPADMNTLSNSHLFSTLTGNSSSSAEGFICSPGDDLRTPSMHDDDNASGLKIRSMMGVEIPHCDFFIHMPNSKLPSEHPNKVSRNVVRMVGMLEYEYSFDNSRGRKHPHSEVPGQECERDPKQSAVYTDVSEHSEMFDRMLLSSGGICESALREAFQNKTRLNLHQSGQSRGPKVGKGRRKKNNDDRKVVDLRNLLLQCAKVVAADNRKKAGELLTEIRQHSSPIGDGMQRVASYFADSLEARMAGTGYQSYISLISRTKTAADSLKGTHFFLAVCPFLKLSNYFSNKTIMHVAEKATTVHIVDFGIYYGFQWPSFIEQLSSRPGGPPMLRITGIDIPISGFRPAERVEQTGRRLASYAEKFHVPFQFTAIAAQKWETIQMEDLKIKCGEVLAVNCLFRFKYLLDESGVSVSPRDSVLNLIRKMNPDIFIHGVVNAAYNVPIFLTRFLEALYHYSAIFDVFETMAPQDIPERMRLERDHLGREIMNAIACEGSMRIERAETYRHWQIRNLRAGFKQIPLNKEIVKTAKGWVKSEHHKDFVVDSDGHWMIQGWKGRILSGLSSWKPKKS